jgi:regulator of protease activity HflC (stomatin/prohibitin superfamily)
MWAMRAKSLRPQIVIHAEASYKAMETLQILVVIAGVLLAAVLSPLFKQWTHEVVYEHQRGFQFRDGKLVGLVGLGRYRLRKGRDHIDLIDVRVQHHVVSNQEILTNDNVAVRCSATVAYAIQDPQKTREVVYLDHAAHLAIQAALRNVIAAYPAEELLRNRQAISEAAEAASRTELEGFGLRLDKLDIRDLILPAEMRPGVQPGADRTARGACRPRACSWRECFSEVPG